MSSLLKEIEEIIDYAKGNSFPTSNLLKHALVVAKKIEDLEFEEFVTKELKGYSSSSLPAHRKVRGQVIILPVPFGSLQRVNVSNLNAEDARKVSTAYVAETVPIIENTINFQGDEGVFTVAFSAENEGVLPSILNEEYGILLFNMQLKELLDDVRTIILDWAIRRQREIVAAAGNIDSFSTTIQPATEEDRIHAIKLYDKVKSLIQNSQTLNENAARIIVESADDAIKEFGSTNQEKKVELRKWRARAELVLPPGTIEELRKRAEGELIKKAYPRNVILRNILLTIVILAVIIGGVLALRQALSGSSEVRPTPSPVKEPVVKFVPLDDKEALIRSFTVKGSGDRVNLKFVAKNIDLTFDLSAPLDTKCDSLLRQIVDHFSLREHVQVDVHMFPTGVSGGSWYPDWRLVLRGQEVGENYEDYDKSLRDLAATDGDRVGIKLKWKMGTLLSSRNGRPTGVKVFPPEVDF